MLKKIRSVHLFALLGLVTFLGVGVTYYHKAGAVEPPTIQPLVTKQLLNPINLLATNLLRGDVVFKYFNAEESTTTEYWTLPSVSSADGDIYVIKRLGGGTYPIDISAHDGDALDLSTDNATYEMYRDAAPFVIAADNANGTWWIISK